MSTEVKKINDDTLSKIIKSVTIAATAMYEIYKIWTTFQATN